MRGAREEVRVVSLASVSVALAAVLSFLGIGMPMGGKLSLEMLPLIALSLINLRAGILASISYGFLKVLLESVPIVHPVQMVLDYPLAFGVLAVGGLFRKPILGATVAVLLRYLIHVISGVIFFSAYAKGDPITYSIIYNATYMLPSGLLTIVLIEPVMRSLRAKEKLRGRTSKLRNT